MIVIGFPAIRHHFLFIRIRKVTVSLVEQIITFSCIMFPEKIGVALDIVNIRISPTAFTMLMLFTLSLDGDRLI